MPAHTAKTLALGAMLAVSVVTSALHAQSKKPIADPIPDLPAPAGFGLVLEEFVTVPKSKPTPSTGDGRLMRRARINHIGEVPDGSGRLYIPDLNGKMYLVENGQVRLYLDVGAEFAPVFYSASGLGQGFGFVSFEPEFKKTGRFYTVHTESASRAAKPDMTQIGAAFHGIITEWTAEDPAANAFKGARREVLRIGFASQIHGIQQIDFNPTAKRGDKDYGMLYLAVGDGGRGVHGTDPQNLSMPHGKLLRIDPRGTNSSNGKYGIPSTNPFVGKPNVLGEIYAYGFRDPHRFSWDSGGTHRMLLGHIGEHGIEAVADVMAGDNHGWSEREGAFVYDRSADACARLHALPPDDEKFGYTYPVAAFDHNPPPHWNCRSDLGHAISGGFVYRGAKVPELAGKYVFGDLVDGRIFYTNESEMRRGKAPAPVYELMTFDKSGKPKTMQDLAGDWRVDLRFGVDAAGELYLLAKANGTVWKVTGTRKKP